MALKIVSFNANSLNHQAKRASFWREALSLQADVLCIQETHFLADTTPHFHHKNFPHTFLASAPTKQKGVLIAIRDSVAFSLTETRIDPEGRYFILVGELNNKPFTIVNLYAQNSHQLRFLKRLYRKLANIQKGSPGNMW